MIVKIRGNSYFYVVILIFIKRHIKDYGVIFAGICAEGRCFLKSVEYDVLVRTTLQCHNLNF